MGASCCNSCETGHGCESEKPASVAPETPTSACCASCEGTGSSCGSGCGGHSSPELGLIRSEFARESQVDDSGEASWEGPAGVARFRRLRSGAAVAVNSRLMMSESSSTASEPLIVGENYAGTVDLVVFGLTSQTTLEVTVETGCGENWSRVVSAYFQNEGFARFRYSVSFPLIRIYYRTIGNQGSKGLVATTVSASPNR